MPRFCLIEKGTDLLLPSRQKYDWRTNNRFDNWVYDSYESAEYEAKYQLDRTGWKYPNGIEVKPFADRTWYERELRRLEEDEYTLPAWENEIWWQDSEHRLMHFAHISVNEPDKIAFTASPEKGMDNLKKVMKPGRYLETYFGEILTKDEIQKWSEKHKGIVVTTKPSKIKWARTPEEIAAVYQMSAGFSSCMQHHASRLNRNIPAHPASAYGAGDFELAYIVSDKDDTRLVARTLVLRSASMQDFARDNSWTMKASSGFIRVGRVYGDEYMMQRELRKEGIETTATNSYYDDMSGAKMLMIPWKQSNNGYSTYVMPYIDSAPGFRVDGDYFVLDTNNYIAHARNTDGTLGRCFKSDKSGQLMFNHDFYTVAVGRNDNGELITQVWADSELENDVFYCRRTKTYYTTSTFKSIALYTNPTDRAFDYFLDDPNVAQDGKDYFTCAVTGKHFLNSYVTLMADGAYWNNYHFRDNGFVSGYDKKAYPNSEQAIVGGVKFTLKQVKRLFYWDRTNQKWTVNRKETARDDLFHDLIGGDSNLDQADDMVNKGFARAIRTIMQRGIEYKNKVYLGSEIIELDTEHRRKTGYHLTYKYVGDDYRYNSYYVIVPDGYRDYSYDRNHPDFPIDAIKDAKLM